jgi:NADP-dependent 3-hydroxy acid dehydrogenase YdfG
MLLGQAVGAPLAEWQQMVELNVLGLLYCAHEALPHLLRAAEDGPRHVADMVNISSVAGRVARNGNNVYSLTKHGVGAFSESLRQEVTKRYVRVSLVEPGATATELASHNRPEVLQSISNQFGQRMEADGHRRRDHLHRDPAAARRDQRDPDPPDRAGTVARRVLPPGGEGP